MYQHTRTNLVESTGGRGICLTPRVLGTPWYFHTTIQQNKVGVKWLQIDIRQPPVGHYCPTRTGSASVVGRQPSLGITLHHLGPLGMSWEGGYAREKVALQKSVVRRVSF